MKRGAYYRASSADVEIRLRVDLDGSWVAIKRPGGETKYFDLPDDHVGAVMAFFPEQGGSPERFKSFVSTIESLDRNRKID